MSFNIGLVWYLFFTVIILFACDGDSTISEKCENIGGKKILCKSVNSLPINYDEKICPLDGKFVVNF